jgi:hypothetical protein
MSRLFWFSVGQVFLMVVALRRAGGAVDRAQIIGGCAVLLGAGLLGHGFGLIVRRLFRRWAAGGAPKGLPPTTPV